MVVHGVGHTRMDRVDGLSWPRTVATLDVLDAGCRARGIPERSRWALIRMSWSPESIAACSCLAEATTVTSAAADAAAAAAAASAAAASAVAAGCVACQWVSNSCRPCAPEAPEACTSMATSIANLKIPTPRICKQDTDVHIMVMWLCDLRWRCKVHVATSISHQTQCSSCSRTWCGPAVGQHVGWGVGSYDPCWGQMHAEMAMEGAGIRGLKSNIDLCSCMSIQWQHGMVRTECGRPPCVIISVRRWPWRELRRSLRANTNSADALAMARVRMCKYEQARKTRVVLI